MPDTINIGTCYWPQPPGWEDYAWTAWDENAEVDDRGCMPYGYGPTEQSAIDDLWDRFYADYP